MAWTLAGITIHPDDKQDAREVSSFYAIQHVLDAAAETVSYYGAGSQRRNLNFVIVPAEAPTGVADFEAATKANADVNLTSDQGSQGNYRILSFRAVRRQALNHTAAGGVWECSAAMIKV